MTTSLDDQFWRAVAGRDAAFDGRFVYAVSRTRIFCRPSCPSRRPKRQGVRFYPDPVSAARAGYRPCKRCRPTEPLDRGREKVRAACAYIERHPDGRVTLAALARHVGCSPFHLQRMFARVVGISPHEYAAARRLERFKSAVRGGAEIPAAVYDAGYGSSSRVYEKAAATLGMTPGMYRTGARGMTIHYTIQDCTLGRLLVAATGRGVCAVKIGDADEALTSALRAEFQAADIRPAAASAKAEGLKRWVGSILAAVEGGRADPDIPLDVRGTAFQWKVWKQLQSIPSGTTKSYGEVARAIGRPTAARAVARACATNPVALVIPCHRVVQGNGASGGYHWGVSKKLALLEKEATKTRRH